MKKQIVVWMFVCGLCLGLSAGFAAEPVQGEPVPAVAVQAVEGDESNAGCDPAMDLPLFAPVFASAKEGPGDSLGTCVADCQYGSNRVCTGSFCFAVDQNCPNTRGYCYGSSTGYRYCNLCPTGCSASASCAGAGGGSVSCNGSGNDCFAIDNCYAYCDGQFHWCPNPGICPV